LRRFVQDRYHTVVTVDAEHLPGAKTLGRNASPEDGWNPVFASDDCGV